MRSCPLLLLLLLAACAPTSPQLVGDASLDSHEVHSRPAALCSRCHSNDSSATALRNSEGDPIAPFDLWQGTMMANSSRDPLWRAMVSAEIALRPKARAAIEEKCLTCHAPTAAADVRQHGGTLSFASLDSPRLAAVARDGVNCTICHGIAPDDLGKKKSFSGGWTIDHSRRAYGPHATPFRMPMFPQTGWTPTEATHILDSALCGSCHTLFTETLDLDGEPTGSVFPEQTPYLEWRASAYSTEGTKGERAQSCQGCHLPTTEPDGAAIATRIARSPMGHDFGRVVPRSPFGQHLLVGGNALVPEILAAHREEFGVIAPEAALRAVAARAREQLAERTADVAIETPLWTEDGLEFAVEVVSHTGHKVPSGHPTRRMWLAVEVTDSAGGTLFSSGVPDRMGQILGAEGAPLASELVGGPVLPWPLAVRSENEVPIFEMVMEGEDGAPTFSLLSAARVAKDSRLLPVGWRPKAARRSGVAAVGVPKDGSFTGGRARLNYVAPIARGDVTIEATLYYQTLGARFGAELAEAKTPEMQRFQELLRERGNAPEVVGRVSLRISAPER